MQDLFFNDKQSDGRAVYTVSRLNQEVRLLLENVYPLIWVEGEISNLSRPSSGHYYFSLKDQAGDGRAVSTVSRHNREVRLLLENVYPLIWVEGEISTLSRPSSGHYYFPLKDQEAQVRCAMFRNTAIRLRFQPKDGMQVLV